MSRRLDPRLAGTIPAYLAGQLCESDRMAFERELERSAELRAELETDRRLLARLGAVPVVRPKRDLTPDILARIGEEEARPRVRFRQLIAVAAAVLLLLGIGLLLSRQNNLRQRDATRLARLRACRWLGRTQREDGSWDITRYGGNEAMAVGVDALALMALLEGGDEFGIQSRAAAAHLLRQQREDGGFGTRRGAMMINHGLATAALLAAAEQYELPHAEEALTEAVAYIVAAQTEAGGWGYLDRRFATPRPSSTAWQLVALQRAHAAGFPAAQRARLRGLAYLRDHHARRDEGHLVTVGDGEALPLMTAMCLLLQEEPAGRAEGASLLEKFSRRNEAGQTGIVDAYQGFLLAQALSRLDRHDGDASHTLRRTQRLLTAHQVQEGVFAGAVPAERATWGHVGGTVYATAMTGLTLSKRL